MEVYWLIGNLLNVRTDGASINSTLQSYLTFNQVSCWWSKQARCMVMVLHNMTTT